VPTFTTRQRVRSLLGLASGVTVHDELIDVLVDVADQMVFDEIDLPAVSGGRVTAFDEYIDIDHAGVNEFAITNMPLVSVVAITTGGTGGSLLDSTNYYSTAWGQVRLTNDDSYFPVGRRKVWITYKAGFVNVPPDLAHAATIIAVHHFNEGPHVGFQSERLSTYNYKLANLGNGMTMPLIAQRILYKYRRAFARP
jgi:hypothetical protein